MKLQRKNFTYLPFIKKKPISFAGRREAREVVGAKTLLPALTVLLRFREACASAKASATRGRRSKAA
jgi:hypothetical protein